MMNDSKMDLVLISTPSLKLISETWILRADTWDLRATHKGELWGGSVERG